ncbi:MAG TPA: FAD-binding oxidoreductase [Trueperaceae bacterium]|nr:FAD-binding oxidoreductase [Trueperaceae bacterium]
MENVPVWDVGAALDLPVLAGSVRADVCVVGLGGSGLSAVSELLRYGVDVVGIDAGVVAGGAAGRNGGFLLAGIAAFHHDAVRELGRDRAVRLYQETAAELDRFAEATPRLVRRTGSLRVADSDAELTDCDQQLRQMRGDGLPVETYQGEEGVGLLFPHDGAFNPLERCRHVARAALAAGARLFEGSAATDVTARRVTTAAGPVECSQVIVAIDGRLDALLPELSPRVRTARLQMLATAPTSEAVLRRPVYRRYGYEYYQQLPGGEVVLGGFRDVAGPGEWTQDATPAAGVQDRLEDFLRNVIGVQAAITRRWAASVGYSTGVLPVFDRVRDGVIACGGYNGTGNLVGALVGRGAAQVAVDGASDLAALFTGSRDLS